MRFEILIQFIIPLMFLAIWALTSLLNRDAQPLPPRPGRPAGPGQRPVPARQPGLSAPLPSRGMDPGGSGAAYDSLRGLPTQSRPATGQTAALRSGQGSLLGPDSAIVFIGPEASPPAPRQESLTAQGGSAAARQVPTSRAARAGQQRRGARQRAAGAAAAQPRKEAKAQRALTDQLNQSMALQRNAPLEITPLEARMAPLAQPLHQASAMLPSTPGDDPGRQAALSAAQVRSMLANPVRLRELALLSEILQPPVVLRPSRRV